MKPIKCTFVAMLTTVCSVAQAQVSPLQNTIDKIQAQALKFPVPQRDTTVLVGDININRTFPVIKYDVPTYVAGHHRCCPTIDNNKKILGDRDVTDVGGIVNITGALRLNLRFTISNWNVNAQNLTVTLGSQSITVANGSLEVIFQNVLDENPAIRFQINGQPCHLFAIDDSSPQPCALNIHWATVGAGVISLPVLPVMIVYAPLVDAKQLNYATFSTSLSKTYGGSCSIESSSSTKEPEFDDLTKVLNGFKDAAKAIGELKKAGVVGDGIATVAEAVAAIAQLAEDAMGQKIFTDQTNIISSEQHSLTFKESITETLKAVSSQGGPGEGDLICFYKSPMFLWLSNNGRMQLALIHINQARVDITVSLLKTKLAALAKNPAGTKDAELGIDADAIRSLLELDPFYVDGPQVILDPMRFRLAKKEDGTDARFTSGGGETTYTVSHQMDKQDSRSSKKVTSHIEQDKAGFLSFLGVGVVKDQTIEMSFTNSSTDITGSGSSATGTLVFHGAGPKGLLNTEVYYDNIFGSFACRDFSADVDPLMTVSGVLFDKSNKARTNAKVLLSAGDRVVSTETDNNGRFVFNLPHEFKKGKLALNATMANETIEFNGKPIKDIVLKTK